MSDTTTTPARAIQRPRRVPVGVFVWLAIGAIGYCAIGAYVWSNSAEPVLVGLAGLVVLIPCMLFALLVYVQRTRSYEELMAREVALMRDASAALARLERRERILKSWYVRGLGGAAIMWLVYSALSQVHGGWKEILGLSFIALCGAVLAWEVSLALLAVGLMGALLYWMFTSIIGAIILAACIIAGAIVYSRR